MREAIYRLRKQLALGTHLRDWQARLAMQREVAPDALLPQLRPIRPRRSNEPGFRINLVVYSLEPEHRFGGIETALMLLAEMGRHLSRQRIVVTMVRPSATAVANLDGFVQVSPHEDEDAVRQVVYAFDGADLPVGPNDIFLTHGWWETRRARHWTAWQAHTFGPPRHPILMLLQEYEPGLYPMSAQSALAEETLRNPGPNIAILNTVALAHHYEAQGYRFGKTLIFEPRMHPRLARKLEEVRGRPKDRIVFCYCRPEVERNAFELVALGLQEWARIFPNAKAWQVISAGAPHRPVRVSPDLLVEAAGKLTLAAYADLIERSAVGLSLMISPHPSYPPLELAHYGVRVVTNRYTNKEPGTWHDNLHAPETLEPAEIGRLLAKLCAEFEAEPQGGWGGGSRMPDYLTADTPFGFADELARSLQGTNAMAETNQDREA